MLTMSDEIDYFEEDELDEDFADLEELEFDDLLFNKVETHVEEQLPNSMKDGVYKNQTEKVNMTAIKNQIALMIGCGSVGSQTIVNLNRLGLSAFIVFDPDVVEVHNSASGSFFYHQYKNALDKGRFKSDHYVSILEHQATSPFKIDHVFTNFITKNDPQVYWKPFKTLFGASPETALQMHRNTMDKFRSTNIYRSSGESQLSEYSNITRKSLSDFPIPTIVVITIDNLKGRLKSVLELYEKYKETVSSLPIIDAGVKDSLKGQVYCFNLLDSDILLAWCNNMLSEKYTNLDDLISDTKAHLHRDKMPFVELDTEECGNKMSIISSQASSLIITSLVRSLFEKDVKPDYNNIYDTTYFSYLMGDYIPILSAKNSLLEVNE